MDGKPHPVLLRPRRLFRGSHAGIYGRRGGISNSKTSVPRLHNERRTRRSLEVNRSLREKPLGTSSERRTFGSSLRWPGFCERLGTPTFKLACLSKSKSGVHAEGAESEYEVHRGVSGLYDPAIRPMSFSKGYRAVAKRRSAYAAMPV